MRLNYSGKLQRPAWFFIAPGIECNPSSKAGNWLPESLMRNSFSYDSANHLPTENDPCWPLMEREIHSFLEANR